MTIRLSDRLRRIVHRADLAGIGVEMQFVTARDGGFDVGKLVDGRVQLRRESARGARKSFVTDGCRIRDSSC